MKDVRFASGRNVPCGGGLCRFEQHYPIQDVGAVAALESIAATALLRLHPEVLGFAGRAWFYNPQLESVSPRLSYLRLRD